MQKLFVLLVLSLASSSAFAATISCVSSGERPIEVSVRTALPGLEGAGKLWLAGERAGRPLSCSVPAMMPSRNRPGADRTYPVASCQEKRGPHSVSITGGGQLGGMIARVSVENRYGQSRVLATMRCQDTTRR